METFADRIRQLRTKAGISQAEMAERLNISRSAVAGYESGEKKRVPKWETLVRMASFFNVTTDYLLGKTENHVTQISENFNETSVPEGNNNGIMEQTLHSVFPLGRLVFVPIVANISCGEPIITEDNMIGTFPVDSSLIPNIETGQYVWLRAKGDSMVNASIHDDSLVLIKLQSTAEDGDIVAASIDNECAMLKHFYRDNGQITLVPDNQKYKPRTYPAERVRIVGVVTWVVTKVMQH